MQKRAVGVSHFKRFMRQYENENYGKMRRARNEDDRAEQSL